MSVKTLKQQIYEMKGSFLNERQVNTELWLQLEKLEDEEDPALMEDITSIFFSEIAQDIVHVEKDLEAGRLDLLIIGEWFHKIKEKSSSFGMLTITAKSKKAESVCEEENLEGIKTSLNELKEEIGTMKEKLHAYFQLLKQVRGGK